MQATLVIMFIFFNQLEQVEFPYFYNNKIKQGIPQKSRVYCSHSLSLSLSYVSVV